MSTSLAKLLDVLCSSCLCSNQIATPCRFNDLVLEQDSTKQKLDSTKQELQASNEHNIVLSEQLAAAQDSLRAAERSQDEYMAQLQQV